MFYPVEQNLKKEWRAPSSLYVRGLIDDRFDCHAAKK